jgi:hypothetical protein
VHIPAKEIAARVSGSTLRTVVCEQCQTEYIYFLTREAEASAVAVLFLDQEGAGIRALGAAQADLRKKLASEHDPIPCPTCGWYQKPMVKVLRAAHWRGLHIAGVILMYIGFLFAAMHVLQVLGAKGKWIDPALLNIGSFFGGIGLTLMVVRKLLSMPLDPNAGDPEVRKKQGRSLALTRPEYDLVAAENPSLSLNKP